MVRIILLLAVATVTILVSESPAAAEDTQCIGLVTGVHDNVVVPPGAFCNLSAATVTGNVKVFGALGVTAGTTIRGNVQGEPGHTFVQFAGGTAVEGNIELRGSVGGFTSGYGAPFQIGGNFQYEENGNFLFAAGAGVGGNLKAEKNTGGGNIFLNNIAGNLECKENAPPMLQFGNVVQGQAKCPE